MVSLNLGSNGARNPATNPQAWDYDGYVQAQVQLLMGGASDAYVFSRRYYPFVYSATCHSRARCVLKAAALESAFQVFWFIHEESIADS